MIFLTSVHLLYLNLHIIESKGIYYIVTTAHEKPKTQLKINSFTSCLVVTIYLNCNGITSR